MHEIEGASHSSFGDYGPQAGDGTPTISDDDMRRQLTELVGANGGYICRVETHRGGVLRQNDASYRLRARRLLREGTRKSSSFVYRRSTVTTG